MHAGFSHGTGIGGGAGTVLAVSGTEIDKDSGQRQKERH